MNAEELKAALQLFHDNIDEIGVTVYAVLKNQEDSSPKKLDIEANALQGLKALFMQSLREKITDKEELSVLDLSTSDERLDAIYLYDIEIPAGLIAMENVLNEDNFPLVDLAEVNLSDIKAILIEIGNNIGQMVLYKTMAPVNVFGRSSFFLKKAKHRMEKINDEFLRISDGFQLLRINGELLVINLIAIEKSFGFHEIIVREAAAGIAAIETLKLVENTAVLNDLLEDVKYARRFTKIAKASPVIKAQVPNASIISFCKTFPKLAGKIRFNGDESKIVLDTNVSKDLFIKLMMDNFLTSELTQYHYDSIAKDSAEILVDEE
ncbi:MAG: DUF4868 domain-containing protein [Gammaproteobacteria bacterium]|nr:MAG: DUF4868 domain-containing protein [Gammaproteobacteria bacterium]